MYGNKELNGPIEKAINNDNNASIVDKIAKQKKKQ